MRSCRPPLFRKRKFDPEVIVTCVRWYLRFSLSLRDLEGPSGVWLSTLPASGAGFRPTAQSSIGGCTASSSESRPPGTWMRPSFGSRASGCTCFELRQLAELLRVRPTLLLPPGETHTLRPMCQTRATGGAAGVPISSSSIPDVRFCRRCGCTSIEWRKDEPPLRRDS